MPVTNKQVASSNINVFPSTRRTYAQEFPARLVTESALARIINKLIDVEGFVITEELDTTGTFEFNIFGYYFQIKNLSYLLSQFESSTQIYATIHINHTDNAFYELYTSTESGNSSNFDGVIFSDDGQHPSDTSTDFYKTLLILNKIDSQWQVPDSSRVKLKDTSLGITEVDAGRINWV